MEMVVSAYVVQSLCLLLLVVSIWIFFIRFGFVLGRTAWGTALQWARPAKSNARTLTGPAQGLPGCQCTGAAVLARSAFACHSQEGNEPLKLLSSNFIIRI